MSLLVVQNHIVFEFNKKYIFRVADPDEQFLLSCLPILKRFNQRKNNLATIKILQLLYDIEYDNMPNETYPQRVLSSASEYTSTSTNLLCPTTGSKTQIPWQPDESFMPYI